VVSGRRWAIAIRVASANTTYAGTSCSFAWAVTLALGPEADGVLRGRTTLELRKELGRSRASAPRGSRTTAAARGPAAAGPGPSTAAG
jgi:hypothetical protein